MVAHGIDPELYAFNCVDFNQFDLQTADYAVPLQFHDADALRRQYGEEHAKYIIPNTRVTALCADKLNFNRAILTGDFGRMIPPIYDTTNRRFPYVMKKRDSFSGEGVFIVRDEEDENRYADHLN